MGEAKAKVDRNAGVKPVVANRSEVDPFALIRAGKGTARDRDRAILAMDEAFIAQIDQFHGILQGLAEREWQLRSYLDAERRWRDLPFWRRWRAPRPVLPLFREFREPPAAKALAEAESKAETGEAPAVPVPVTAGN